MNKILVIDNEYEVVEMISEILMINGYQTKTATNGRSAIRTTASFNPDLILCDISMPELSGYDVLEAVRSDQKTHAIPFIFLTAKTGMQDLRKGMLLGADDYLTKPISTDELLASVKTRLEKHQQMIRHYRAEIEQTRYNLEITKNFNSLTGLPKRSVLEKILNADTFIDDRAKHYTALFVLKFNRFKHLIDILGKEEAKRLITEFVRRVEKVSASEKNVYYLDDGEFGLLLTNLTNTNLLQSLAQKILKQIRKPFIWDMTELNCSACIGIAIAANQTLPDISLIRNAELAMDKAIEAGFNTFRFYDEDIKQRAFDQINIENALHKALERREFKIYYQPKIDSTNRNIIGSEALIRWENVEYGLLSPAQFVPIAEENGLIVPIGEWVLENICQQLNIWKDNGIEPQPVAVNISARQLEQKNFVNSITSILDRTKIENELLEIELTESILLKNSKKNSRKLSKLRNKGMKVSIDDFGTGYSSLSYLSNFPFDKLKIDQSFIRDITTDKAAAALATSIISMAHSLGVRVIAEGVETEAQLDFLKNYHCDEIQGYYFSKPITADAFTTLLKETAIPALDK